MQTDVSDDIGLSSVLEKTISCMERTLTVREEKWNEDANPMLKHCEESGHPRGISAFNSGILKKNGGRSTIHFTTDSANMKLLLRTIHTANQISIFGAVSSWCEDLVENVLGQTSMGVDRSISKMNDQLSNQPNPQEVSGFFAT